MRFGSVCRKYSPLLQLKIHLRKICILWSQPPVHLTELLLQSAFALEEALQQINSGAKKRIRQSSNFYEIGKDDSCPQIWEIPRWQKKLRDFESYQSIIIESIMDAASQLEPITSTLSSLIIGIVSPSDLRICLADHSLDIDVNIDAGEFADRGT